MKVPKHIQNKMRKVAKLHKEAIDIMIVVDEYFSNKLPESKIDALRCGNGMSLEELEYGNDITDDFVKWAENDFKY